MRYKIKTYFSDREFKILNAALYKEEKLYESIGNYELVNTIKSIQKKISKLQSMLNIKGVSENNNVNVKTKNKVNKYRKFHDGWFTYFVNVENGETKFQLDTEDMEV